MSDTPETPATDLFGEPDYPDSEFVAIFDEDEIAPGQAKCAAVNGRMVAVFNDAGTLRAIDDMCPHQGASLSEGHFEKGEVMCPWHAWRFSLTDGSWLDSDSGKVKCGSYPVRVIDEEICVRVPKHEATGM